MKWPLKYRIWKKVHSRLNRLAWRYADPGGPDWGKALRIDRTRPLWKLNDWAANHYVDWYVRTRAERGTPCEPNN